MEQELSGEKGSKTVYVDTVGRITEVLDETDPKAGNAGFTYNIIVFI